MLLLDIYNKTKALIDQYTEDGVEISDAELADIKAKFILFADMAQKELYSVGRYYKTFEFTTYPIDNLLGCDYGMKKYSGTPLYFPSDVGVANPKGYYIEVDSPCTIEIIKVGVGVLTTITVPTTVTDMTAYKGAISETGDIYIKVTGNYTAHIQNVCLYADAYYNIPDYRPMRKIQMPDDFISLNDVVEESFGEYIANGLMAWEGYRDLYVSDKLEANIRMTYKALPTTLTATSDTLMITENVAQAIAYYCAAKIATSDSPSLVNFFEQKYNELKFELSSQISPKGETQIYNVYGGF